VGLIRSVVLWNLNDENKCNITEIIIRFGMTKSDKGYEADTMAVRKNINSVLIMDRMSFSFSIADEVSSKKKFNNEFFLPKDTMVKDVKIDLISDDVLSHLPETDSISMLKANMFFGGEGCLNSEQIASVVDLGCYTTMESLFENFEI